jgi:endonuclease YncB( thermonuclease family)
VRPAAAAVALAFGTLAGARDGAAQGRLSEHAAAAQTIANTTITVEYYRPAARGRDSLFGKVVTWGEHWTPGANWATTLETDHDVRVYGHLLPKGKYAVWTVVRPDRWQVEFHRTWRKFHVPPPSDSTDEQLRFDVTPASGPPVEVLTFDFPEVRPAATTLRLRWGTAVVSLPIAAIPPPLALLPSGADATPYLGRYDSHLLQREVERGRREREVEVVRAGDTLRVHDADGPAAERRDFVLSPAGEAHEFRLSRRAADGQYWPESGAIVTFSLKNGRATGYEVESEDGGTGERAERR